MQKEKVVGIFSKRNYTRNAVFKGESSRTIAVKGVMTSEILTMNPDLSIEGCMALMTNKHIHNIRCFRKPFELISIGDIAKTITSEHEYTIKSMENYFTPSR